MTQVSTSPRQGLRCFMLLSLENSAPMCNSTSCARMSQQYTLPGDDVENAAGAIHSTRMTSDAETASCVIPGSRNESRERRCSARRPSTPHSSGILPRELRSQPGGRPPVANALETRLGSRSAGGLLLFRLHVRTVIHGINHAQKHRRTRNTEGYRTYLYPSHPLFY